MALPRMNIPWNSRADDAIGSVVEKAAKRAGMSKEDYAVAMTFFFEETAAALCHGQTVTLRGFGQWGPWPYRGKKKTTKDLPAVCLPRFQAAKGFRNEVMTTCAPKSSVMKAMTNYKQNHCQAMAVEPTTERVCTSMHSLRQIVLMQQAKRNMGRAG